MRGAGISPPELPRGAPGPGGPTASQSRRGCRGRTPQAPRQGRLAQPPLHLGPTAGPRPQEAQAPRGPRRGRPSTRAARGGAGGPGGRLGRECGRGRCRRGVAARTERGLLGAAGARGPAGRWARPPRRRRGRARRPHCSARGARPAWSPSGRWRPRALTSGAEHEVERAVPCCCHSEARPCAMPGGGGCGRLGAARRVGLRPAGTAPRRGGWGQEVGGAVGSDRGAGAAPGPPPGGRERARLQPRTWKAGCGASLKQWWKRGRRAPRRASPMAAPRAKDRAGAPAVR